MMIHTLATTIINVFEKNNVLQHEKEIYQHGLELILSYMVGLIIQIIFCIVTGFWIETTMFIIFFESLRRYTGGYHASTYWGCNVVYLFAYGVYYLWVTSIEVTIPVLLMVYTISSICICIKAPITHEHNPLSKIERVQYKRKSILFVSLFTSVFVLLLITNHVYYALNLTVPIFMNAILMILGLLFNERGDLD